MDILSTAAMAQDAAIGAATQVGENVLREGGGMAYVLLITSILFFVTTAGMGWLLLRTKDAHAKEKEELAARYGDDVMKAVRDALAPVIAGLTKVELGLEGFKANLRTDLKDMFGGVDDMISTVTTLIIKMTEAQGKAETQSARLVDRLDNLNVRKSR